MRLLIVTLPAPDAADIARIRAQQSFARAFGSSLRVIVALVAREGLSRYGSSRLGYLWAFLEPSLYFVVFLALRTLTSDIVPFGESAVFAAQLIRGC